MTQTSTYGLFRHKPFLFFFLGSGCSELAYQIAFVALGWQVYELTNSAMDLGLIGLIQFLPSVLFVFVIGHVADKYNRKKLLQICQILEALTAVFLCIGTAYGWLTVNQIFISVGVLGVCAAFEGPSGQALMPSVIPKGMIAQGTTIGSSIYQMGAVAGPALGGVAYALSKNAPFLLMSVLWASAAVLNGLIRVDPHHSHMSQLSQKTIDQATESNSQHDKDSVYAGARFVKENPLLLGTLSLDLFAVLLGGATTLLPIYAKDILDTGAWGLGLLRSAPAVGALIMTTYLSRFALKSRVGMKMFNSVIVFGIATVLFALSTEMWLSLTALAVMGAADMVSVVIRSSLVQLATPEKMRGRVSAVNFLFINASNQLGGFESGLTAAVFGVVNAAAIGGIGTVIIALIWMRLFPSIKEIDKLE